MTTTLDKRNKAKAPNDISLHRNAHTGIKAQTKSVVNRVAFGMISTVVLMTAVSIATREIVYTVAPQIIDEITTEAVRSLPSH